MLMLVASARQYTKSCTFSEIRGCKRPKGRAEPELVSTVERAGRRCKGGGQ